MPQLNRVIEGIKTSFKERLQIKTGWGKDEVYNEFLSSIGEALVEEVSRSASDLVEGLGEEE